jgi:hypothetical protein
MIEVFGASFAMAGGARAWRQSTRTHYRWLVGLLVLCAAGAAHAAGEVIAEAYFKQDPRTVSALLANICMDRQATVVEQDEFHVLCSKQKGGMKGALLNTLLSNPESGGGAPGKKTRFTIASSQYGTRVQVSQWIDAPLAYSQFAGGSDSGKARSEMQAALVQAGGSLTPLTQETAPAPMPANAPPAPAGQASNPPPAMCGFSPCAPH